MIETSSLLFFMTAGILQCNNITNRKARYQHKPHPKFIDHSDLIYKV